MEIYYVVAIVAVVLMGMIGYLVGNRGRKVLEGDKKRLETDIQELKREKEEKE